MNSTVRLFCVGALTLAAAGMAAADTVIYKQDFESGAGETAVVAGQLVGQDGWFSVSSGTGLQIAVGAGNANLGYLDNMQVVPNVPQAAGNIVARTVGALDPTKVYKLTFDADDFKGGFGMGGADGNYKFAIRYDGPTMALDTRGLLGVAYPAGYDLFPFPSSNRESFEVDIDGPNNTLKAYYNAGAGNVLIGTQSPSSAQIAGLSTIAYYSTGTGSNAGFGVDNIVLTQVPEPSTLTLLGCGLFAFSCYVRKKRS